MIEDELIKIWQSSPNQKKIKFNKSRLMLEVQSGMDRIHRKIYWRDLREATFAVITIGWFVYGISFRALPVLSRVSAVIICIWGVFSIWYVLNVRRQKPDTLTLSYVEYLNKTKSYLLIQIRLLNTALYWFIIPFLGLVALFLLGFWGVPEKTTSIIEAGLASLAGAILIYVLHKVAVKHELNPRLEKVEELIRAMEK